MLTQNTNQNAAKLHSFDNPLWDATYEHFLDHPGEMLKMFDLSEASWILKNPHAAYNIQHSAITQANICNCIATMRKLYPDAHWSEHCAALMHDPQKTVLLISQLMAASNCNQLQFFDAGILRMMVYLSTKKN